MPAPRIIAALLAVATAVACTSEDPPPQPQPEDPCALTTRGAPWLAFATRASGDWEVALVRADATCRRALTSDPADDLDPAWGSPRLLAYASSRPPHQSVWLRDLEAGTERRLDVGDLRASAPAFSPDGRTLAFEGRFAGSTASSIYVVPVAGGPPVELTPEATPHGNGRPLFSPDGATVYFVSNRSSGTALVHDVFRVPAAGGAAVQVTAGSGIQGRPALSPDGRTLAFARSAGGGSEVVLHDLVEGTTRPLGVASASEPAFDPAGSALVVKVYRGLNANLDLAPLPVGTTTRVTYGLGPDGVPAFAPIGP